MVLCARRPLIIFSRMISPGTGGCLRSCVNIRHLCIYVHIYTYIYIHTQIICIHNTRISMHGVFIFIVNCLRTSPIIRSSRSVYYAHAQAPYSTVTANTIRSAWQARIVINYLFVTITNGLAVCDGYAAT